MEKEKQPIYKKWWFWLIVVFLILGVISGAYNDFNLSNEIENSTKIDISTTEKEVIFLKGSKGKEFYNIMCEVANVENKKAQDMKETWIYETGNDKYSIELEANKSTNEINYIRLMTFKNEYNENFFLAISRLEYNESDRKTCFNWIKDNIGKENTTKIGDANFKLSIGTNKNPILEVYTDGNEKFQQEQTEKYTK